MATDLTKLDVNDLLAELENRGLLDDESKKKGFLSRLKKFFEDNQLPWELIQQFVLNRNMATDAELAEALEQRDQLIGALTNAVQKLGGEVSELKTAVADLKNAQPASTPHFQSEQASQPVTPPQPSASSATAAPVTPPASPAPAEERKDKKRKFFGRS